MMVGWTLLTVRFTVMLCDFIVTGAPEATIVIFAVYGAVCGERFPAVTATVNISNSPGVTTPVFGETVSHGTPAVAVNEIGAPFVDIEINCGAGSGGAVKFRVV